jgi:diguanylate cyclase (GGDEF)-like protein
MAARRSSFSSRFRAGPLAALVVVVALLPILVAATVVEHRNRSAREQRALRFEAQEHTDVLLNYFAQATSLTKVLGQNPAFREFYELPGSRLDKVRRGDRPVIEANAALAYVEKLFPGRIGEACFIDRAGAENARAVRGRIAPIGDLSTNETATIFFAPTFALPPGRVYHSPPYVSPDTHEWVIANSTPVPAPNGRTRAIVHFEVTIESFRKVAGADVKSQYSILVVDAKTGSVVIDSRLPQRVGARLGDPSDRRFDSIVGRMTGTAGTFGVDGHHAAFVKLRDSDRNANDWLVVAVANKRAQSWLGSIDIFEGGVFAALLLLLGFAVASFRTSQRELTTAAYDDPLTRLGNRRSLINDLERRLDSRGSHVLVLCDLDGFKGYNDAFGHPAGDALLVRLAHKLRAAVADVGTAYRMGGDEFCIVATASADTDALLVPAIESALSEHGDGFDITTSHGEVRLPSEASSVSEALRIADQRMYANKATGRASAARQGIDLLLRVLSERHPELGAHLTDVAALAAAVARRLDLAPDRVSEVERAAELHDLGKIAIPDGILSKPTVLDDAEWEFMRRHPVIGERILGAAPSLLPLAPLVRSSHERIDGKGYPDGLKGDAIPLGARIIFVCDAFDAMTSERPYRSAMSAELALEELRRCSGTQFDAAIVEALCAVVLSGGARRGAAAGNRPTA